MMVITKNREKILLFLINKKIWLIVCMQIISVMYTVTFIERLLKKCFMYLVHSKRRVDGDCQKSQKAYELAKTKDSHTLFSL